MEVERMVYVCNNCLEYISDDSEQAVQVVGDYAGTYVYIPGSKYINLLGAHFCSVDCLCEFIKFKALEAV